MNANQSPPPISFPICSAIFRSLCWGLAATALLSLTLFIPGVNIIPAVALYMLSGAGYLLLHTFGASDSFGEPWSLVIAFALCALILAFFRLTHLVFIHLHVPSAGDGGVA